MLLNIIDSIQKYWTILAFCIGLLIKYIQFEKSINNATKCSLRNDILSIYNDCKKDKKISMYELQAIQYSYDEYKKRKGNSFVDEIVNKVKNFEVID